MEFLLIFSVGMLAGGMAAIAGSGGLVSIPALVLLGLPAEVAIATNRFGSLGVWITATYRYIRGKRVEWRYAKVLVFVVPLGAFFGAQLLVQIDKEFLSRLVALLVLALVPFSFVSKEFGAVRRETTKLSRRCGYCAAFLVAIFGGFFSGGDGTLMMFSLVGFFGLTITEATATRALPYFLLSCTSVSVYLFSDLIDFQVGIVLFFGMATGGYLGAHTAIKKGDRWARAAFVVITIGMCAKLLLFP